MPHLPGRTREAIEEKAKTMKLRSNAPAPHALSDQAILDAFRGIKDPVLALEAAAETLGVKPRTLRDRAKRLGISFETANWTEQELQLLADHYPLGGVHACLYAGLERDAMSIRNKARRLGIAAPASARIGSVHRAPRAEPTILEKVFDAAKAYLQTGDYDRDAIAAALGTRSDSVSKALAQLVKTGRLPPDSKMPWTQAEIELLRAHYPVGAAPACIANGLNRTESAIQSQAKRLGIAFVRS